jgi:hypothetical protein
MQGVALVLSGDLDGGETSFADAASLAENQRTRCSGGKEIFLSRSTVKSEAISIYQKLGASSWSQAVARARELGLLDG